ncbi:MAG TPA: ATP-binding protein [Thermoanaerobaculia bacterium]|nr:ATP-binding protein [Thermoanaerobaculia bacterium]
MEVLLLAGLAWELRRCRKQFAREAWRHRQELEHVSRVTTLSALAGSLSHELKQPLTAIRSNLQAARLFLAAEPPDLDEIREILAAIEEDGERAGELIERVRGLLRKERGELEPLRLDDIVQHAAGLLRSEAVARGVELWIDAAPGLPRVSGNPVQLLQVLLNLGLNALEAMGANPTGKGHLFFATRRAGSRSVEVIVRDSGGGIDLARIERIFEPFYTTKREGLGLGLAITRSIVAAHGGRVWARNADEGGAAFHVLLPALAGGGSGGPS